MNKMQYIGCFFPSALILEKAAQLYEERLYRTIAHPHVTFSYMPETVPYESFGKVITLRVVSYGCDGENEAFGVEFTDLPEELIPLARDIAVPHITISVSKTGKTINSRSIPYTPIEPFTLQGIFGGMGTNGQVYTRKPE